MLTDHLEQQQLGMSVAGSHQLVHAIRMTLDADPEEVCVRIDFHNADTSVYWRTVGDSLADGPHPAAWPPVRVLVPATALETHGKLWGPQGAAKGRMQGDPETGVYFNVGIQEDVEGS